MKNMSQHQQSISAMRRVFISLISKNALTVSKMDKLSQLALNRGFCQSHIEELMVECYAEVGVG